MGDSHRTASLEITRLTMLPPDGIQAYTRMSFPIFVYTQHPNFIAKNNRNN